MSARDVEGVDPKIAELIRCKAQRLARTGAFRTGDEEDLRQELWLNVLSGMKRHDPRRAGRRTFATRIVATRSISIAKRATAQKRDRRRERSIDRVIESAVAPGEPPTCQVDLALDVTSVLAGLPGDLRQVATLFMKHGSEAPLVRESGLTRQAVRGMRRRIGEHLRQGGLG